MSRGQGFVPRQKANVLGCKAPEGRVDLGVGAALEQDTEGSFLPLPLPLLGEGRGHGVVPPTL